MRKQRVLQNGHEEVAAALADLADNQMLSLLANGDVAGEISIFWT